MKLKKIDGLYYATYKHRDGAICMGYSANIKDAIVFCIELINERDKR